MSQINPALKPETRRYDLDWLRVIAILILLFYHTGMIFVPWNFHIKNNETSNSFMYWMIWLHYWRMPLLLFISGAGTYMALGKRTPGQFVKERFIKLLIPLIFGMFVVVPPQIYFEHIKEYSGYWDFYKTVFNFVPYPRGSFSWHHLWFIIYLLFYSLLALPLLVYLRSSRATHVRTAFSKLLSHPLALLIVPAVIILITQILLRPYFPEETHNFKDWAYFVFYFCFFLFGMVCYSSSSLWEAIGKKRNFLLGATLLAMVLFYVLFFHITSILTLPWSDDFVETTFDVVAIFLSWFTVITVIAYGQHYLNKHQPVLARLSEGTYPFYILHQTAIICLGYYICQLDWSIAAKFWSVSLLSLISCVGFYFLLIRPISVMRVLFGMKRREREERDKR
jgi:glucans biosynthesis protein C